MKAGPWIISGAALLVSLASFYNSSHEEKKEDRFTNKILTSVKSCIEYNQDITQKDDILQLLSTIKEDYQSVATGSDDLRVKFVNSQGCIEHVLACYQALGEIDQLIGVIHTPTPATPLCVKPEGRVEDILDESIRYDLAKLLTVRSRAQIVREYLIKGGKLYVVYPKGGLEKRTVEQQHIYRDELQRYKGRLFDWMLATMEMHPDMIRATYLFRNTEGQVYAFSIKARQANDIQPKAEWGIWLGPIDDAKVAKRINSVFDYLADNEGPDIRSEFATPPRKGSALNHHHCLTQCVSVSSTHWLARMVFHTNFSNSAGVPQLTHNEQSQSPVVVQADLMLLFFCQDFQASIGVPAFHLMETQACHASCALFAL